MPSPERLTTVLPEPDRPVMIRNRSSFFTGDDLSAAPADQGPFKLEDDLLERHEGVRSPDPAPRQMQAGNTGDLVFDIPHLVEFITAVITLEMLATGKLIGYRDNPESGVRSPE